MKGVVIAVLALLTFTIAGANPLLEYGGRWVLVGYRVNQGERGVKTGMGWDPEDPAQRAKQWRSDWRPGPKFSGKAILTDSPSIITFHLWTDAKVYLLKGKIKPGKSNVVFLMGTDWDAGHRFRVVARLKKDHPYDSILLPDDSELDIRLKKKRREEGELTPVYDMLELDLIDLGRRNKDRVERFRFRRITN